MNLDKSIALINKTEGRDKFCKMIQYACRFLKYVLRNGNKDVVQRIDSLLTNMATARKLFRLFKTVNEYHKVIGLLSKSQDDEFDLYMNILSRVFFGAYWVFDNLAVLSAIKFLKQDKVKLTKSASWCWFLALLVGLVLYVRNLVYESNNAITLEKAIHNATAKDRQGEVVDKNKELGKVNQKKTDLWLNIIKTVGDMITASQGAGIPRKLLGIDFNDGAIGIGGFVSAAITEYQLY